MRKQKPITTKNKIQIQRTVWCFQRQGLGRGARMGEGYRFPVINKSQGYNTECGDYS